MRLEWAEIYWIRSESVLLSQSMNTINPSGDPSLRLQEDNQWTTNIGRLAYLLPH